MHLPDGLIPPLFCGIGYAGMGGLVWWSARQLKRQQHDPLALVPRLAMLTAAFFAASAVYIPLPLTSVHLLLVGSLGALLGYGAMIAIVVGLFLQAVMFGHGGLTTLGLNALMMGVPALLAAGTFHRLWPRCHGWGRSLVGFGIGSGGVLLVVITFSAFVILTLPANIDHQREIGAILAIAIAHLPLAIVEGVFTAALLNFLDRVKPQIVKT